MNEEYDLNQYVIYFFHCIVSYRFINQTPLDFYKFSIFILAFMHTLPKILKITFEESC